MKNRDLNTIAVRQTAQAVVSELLETGSVVTVSVVPSATALGFVQFDPKPAMQTSTDIENRITTLLADRAISSLTGQADTNESSLAQAHRLAQELADSQDCTWRESQPDLVNDVLRSCLDRATKLVAAHKDRIFKVAAILAEQGTITGHQLAAL